MGINIHVKDDWGELLDSDATTAVVEARDLPDFADRRFPHLRLIDPYGNTVFTQYQLEHGVLDELEGYASERPSPGINTLLAKARRCATQPRTALWLTGD